MDFALTDRQEQWRQEVATFASRRLLPGVREREAAHLISPPVMKAVADFGLIGVNVASEWGGAARGVVAYALAVRELAYVDPAVAVTMAVTNMVSEVIETFGTEAQRRRYLPKLTRGDYFAGAFALSEPGAGSDAASLTTRATQEGGDWVLSGEKMWISHGDQSDVLVVWARTGGAGAAGISCFLVDRGTPGLTAGKPEEKMGLRASHTVGLSLDQVRLPPTALLGREGEGFKVAMAALDGGRIGVGAQSLGMGYRALELARGFAQAHLCEGHTLAELEAYQWPIANLGTELDAAWLLVLRAAWLKENGRPFPREAAMAKAFASEAANRAVRATVDLLGGDSSADAVEAVRLFRDCRVTQIYEGTSEVQRVVIARDVLKTGVLP